MPKSVKPALLASAVSVLLFLFIFGIGLGFGFMFLPTLPLFFAGYRYGASTVRLAILTAIVPISLMMGLAGGLVYLILLAWPAMYLCQHSLRGGFSGENQFEWKPIGRIMLDLTLSGCVLICLVTAYYWPQEGGLPAMLTATIREAFSGLEAEYGAIIDRAAVQWAFLVFPVTLWLWGLLLYGHAWLGNRLARRGGRALRPDMAIAPFSLPTWMLSLLAICALASLIGSESMRFLGKACLISLLLPYFFAGAALLRQSSAKWPNGGFFIFFVYFMVFTQFWPALILAGVGLWRQIKDLSAGDSSFRK